MAKQKTFLLIHPVEEDSPSIVERLTAEEILMKYSGKHFKMGTIYVVDGKEITYSDLKKIARKQ